MAGQPSRADFEFHDRADLHQVATGRDELPRLVPGRDDYRVLVVRGVLVRAISVIGQLAPDGLELVELELDTIWPDDDADTDQIGDGAED